MTITDLTFDPGTLELPSGQDITLQVTNNDDVEHSFTLDDDSVTRTSNGRHSVRRSP